MTKQHTLFYPLIQHYINIPEVFKITTMDYD